jgi:hypothetical protein
MLGVKEKIEAHEAQFSPFIIPVIALLDEGTA